jgi:hypothetical protein
MGNPVPVLSYRGGPDGPPTSLIGGGGPRRRVRVWFVACLPAVGAGIGVVLKARAHFNAAEAERFRAGATSARGRGRAP